MRTTGIAKVGWAVGAGLVRRLFDMFDLGATRYLTEQTTQHVLDELPRMTRLIEERFEEVRASGCTPEQARILAHKAVEAQTRTIDDEKRRRLSNVLINGLCAKDWKMARHRSMVRFAAELEEEHVDYLRQHFFRDVAEGSDMINRE